VWHELADDRQAAVVSPPANIHSIKTALRTSQQKEGFISAFINKQNATEFEMHLPTDVK